MSDIAIRVQGLGKQYHIGAKQEKYGTLRDTMVDAARTSARALSSLVSRRKAAADESRSFWALKDVNFTVKRGEVIGIIGHNGAGKSTLLKLLSRITEPTEGFIDIEGRVASLLEVGTGFHPELSGRENIYLNGAILGMKRTEIVRKFDEIVDFAEVEKFIDTPVKHYSSGMYLRLAFGVAAHLEPEILVVDEVLAVGDAVFQKKCLGKMSDVANHGRTIVFVSHNMGALSNLCHSCICLKQGQIIDSGPTASVIAGYLARISEEIPNDGYADLSSRARPAQKAPSKASLASVQLCNTRGQQAGTFLEGEPIEVKIEFEVRDTVSMIQLAGGASLLEGGVDLFMEPSPEYCGVFKPGLYSARLKVQPNYLREGVYRLVVKLFADGQRQDTIGDCLTFNIQPFRAEDDSAALGHKWISGRFLFRYEWSRIEAFDQIGQKSDPSDTLPMESLAMQSDRMETVTSVLTGGGNPGTA